MKEREAAQKDIRTLAEIQKKSITDDRADQRARIDELAQNLNDLLRS